MQHWVAECRFDGRASFWVGAFLVPKRLSEDDAEAKAKDLALAFLADIHPEWMGPPEILQIAKGTMLLILDSEDSE